MSDAREHALEVAVDAIVRRARALDGADPDVAMALRFLATELEYLSARKVTPAEMRRREATIRRVEAERRETKRAKEAWL